MSCCSTKVKKCCGKDAVITVVDSCNLPCYLDETAPKLSQPMTWYGKGVCPALNDVYSTGGTVLSSWGKTHKGWCSATSNDALLFQIHAEAVVRDNTNAPVLDFSTVPNTSAGVDTIKQIGDFVLAPYVVNPKIKFRPILINDSCRADCLPLSTKSRVYEGGYLLKVADDAKAPVMLNGQTYNAGEFIFQVGSYAIYLLEQCKVKGKSKTIITKLCYDFQSFNYIKTVSDVIPDPAEVCIIIRNTLTNPIFNCVNGLILINKQLSGEYEISYTLNLI